MSKYYITEAFKEFNILDEAAEEFALNPESLDDMSSFIDLAGDDVDDIEIYDLQAEAEDELQDSYNGKVILQCKVCQSDIFEDRDNIDIDEKGLVNVSTECPYCQSNDGYNIIGQVSPFNPDEDFEEPEVNDLEIEDEMDELNESFSMKPSDRLKRSENIRGKKELKSNKKVRGDNKIRGEKTLSETFHDFDEDYGEYDSEWEKISAGLNDPSRIKQSNTGYFDNNEEDLNLSDHNDLASQRASGEYDSDWEKISADLNESFDHLIKPDMEKEDVFKELDDALREAKEGRRTIVKLTKNPGTGRLALAKQWAKNRGINLLCVNARDFDDTSLGGLGEPDLGGFVAKNSKTLDSAGLNFKTLNQPNSVLFLDDAYRTPSKVRSDVLNLIRNHETPEGRVLKNFLFTIVVVPDKTKKMNEDMDDWEKISRGLNEDINDISITTDNETLTMTPKEDGGISLETSPMSSYTDEIEDNLDSFEMGDEMIAPISDEEQDEILNGVEGEDEEIPLDEIEEDTFDELSEAYLKRCYENVKGFKTSNVLTTNNQLIIEGLITFDSGNTKSTRFIFKPSFIDKHNKIRFTGLNEQISKGKKSFKLNCKLNGRKLTCESLNYNYRSKNELNESVRVYGTVKKR